MQTIHTGRCVGGPFNGKEGQSRFPAGFVAVDRVNGQAWIYDWNGDQFNVRNDGGMPLDDEKRWRAAESADWDVRAV